MPDSAYLDRCNQLLLRSQLMAALVEADKCDPIVAIHIVNAITRLDEAFGQKDQSSVL